MRLPIKINKQRQPVLASDNAMSVRLTKKPVVEPPVRESSSTPLACTNEFFKLHQSLAYRDSLLANLEGVVTSVDEPSGLVTVSWAPDSGVTELVLPEDEFGNRFYIYKASLEASICDIATAVMDWNITVDGEVSRLQTTDTFSILIVLEDPYTGVAIHLSPVITIQGKDYALGTTESMGFSFVEAP